MGIEKTIHNTYVALLTMLTIEIPLYVGVGSAIINDDEDCIIIFISMMVLGMLNILVCVAMCARKNKSMFVLGIINGLFRILILAILFNIKNFIDDSINSTSFCHGTSSNIYALTFALATAIVLLCVYTPMIIVLNFYKYIPIDILCKNKIVCPICMDEELSINSKTLECGHTYCERCIDKWLSHNNVCPNCRAHVQIN
jgi:hypothetical protein